MKIIIKKKNKIDLQQLKKPKFKIGDGVKVIQPKNYVFPKCYLIGRWKIFKIYYPPNPLYRNPKDIRTYSILYGIINNKNERGWFWENELKKKIVIKLKIKRR